MAWASVETSDALTLSGSYQTVQKSTADWVQNLNPGESCVVTLKFDPQTTPTENVLVGFYSSPDDGTTYDSDDSPFMAVLLENGSDPNTRSLTVRGMEQFRLRAKLLNTDGTAGGTDTGSTLTGISAKTA